MNAAGWKASQTYLLTPPPLSIADRRAKTRGKPWDRSLRPVSRWPRDAAELFCKMAWKSPGGCFPPRNRFLPAHVLRCMGGRECGRQWAPGKVTLTRCPWKPAFLSGLSGLAVGVDACQLCVPAPPPHGTLLFPLGLPELSIKL